MCWLKINWYRLSEKFGHYCNCLGLLTQWNDEKRFKLKYKQRIINYLLNNRLNTEQGQLTDKNICSDKLTSGTQKLWR